MIFKTKMYTNNMYFIDKYQHEKLKEIKVPRLGMIFVIKVINY